MERNGKKNTTGAVEEMGDGKKGIRKRGLEGFPLRKYW